MLSIKQLQRLIQSGQEGVYWDFKQQMYAFDDPSESKRNHARNGFVKDIVCLHNGHTNCQRFAYIIIGVEDQTMRLIGMPEDCDEKQLQEIIGDKLSPCPKLRFYKMEYQNIPLGIIEIDRSSPSAVTTTVSIWKTTQGKPKAELVRGDIWYRKGSFNHKAETVWERYLIRSSFPIWSFCLLRNVWRGAILLLLILTILYRLYQH